jgi:hypothetical protein
MLPAAAKLCILAKKRKKIDRIFRDYFSRRSPDDFTYDESGLPISDSAPIAQIRWVEPRLGHNRIVIVPRFKRNKELFTNNVRSESLSNLKGKKYSGLLTDSAILGIKRAFEKMLVYSEPFMAYDFRTGKRRSSVMVAWLITIPHGYGPITGKTFNQLVSELIKRVGQKYPKFRMYLGKVEYTGNGMEHCHLDVNTFIDYYFLHKTWFTILRKQRCFQQWLSDHPTNDPDHFDFDPRSKDNLVGYRPLWTSSGCISYLGSYLKKMTQNKIPVKGRVWFQSKYLAKQRLPLIQLSKEQQQILEQSIINNHVKVRNVSINSYKVDGDGVISDQVHHTKTLCTIYKSIYKKKDTIPISEFLTDYNRNRLISYRVASREGCEGPSDHSAVFGFRVVYARNPEVKVLSGRPPGINSLDEVPCPNILQGHRILKKSMSSNIFYNKVEFNDL